MIYEFEGSEPEIDDDAHVCDEATLIGNVRVEEDASVWPGVVLRGDVGQVVVGRESHIGDNSVLHIVEVGERVMVGHGSVLNDATVSDGTLIGSNATINTGVRIGDRCIVASGTVVPEDTNVASKSFMRGVPASITSLSETTLNPEEIFESYSSGDYTNLASRHTDLFG